MFSVELTRFPINEMVSESSPGGIYIPPPGFTFTCGMKLTRLPKDGHINVFIVASTIHWPLPWALGIHL